VGDTAPAGAHPVVRPGNLGMSASGAQRPLAARCAHPAGRHRVLPPTGDNGTNLEAKPRPRPHHRIEL